jgi:hypothetical protein
MEKRDYIEAMIKQLGVSLKKMLSRIIKGSGVESTSEVIAETEKEFCEIFSSPIDELLLLSKIDFENYILQLKLKENHLESFSELFYQMSLLESSNVLKQQYLKVKAIELLELANLVSNSYSIIRNDRKNNIINTQI